MTMKSGTPRPPLSVITHPLLLCLILQALDKVLGWTLRPRSLALLLLATTSATWRLKLSMAERRAAVWEGRCAMEGGKRAAAETELARALQRLAEVRGWVGEWLVIFVIVYVRGCRLL